MQTGYNNIKWKDPRLGRYIPANFDHVEKHPFSLSAIKRPSPMAIGINWYASFDVPVWDEKARIWWIGKDPNNLGSLRGGHALCVPSDHRRNKAWWIYYDQLSQGACVDFAITQCMSENNHKLYKKFWLWDRAKEIDEYEETNPGDNNGTSVNAGLRALMNLGHIPLKSKTGLPELKEGISAFNWARDEEAMLVALDNPLYRKRNALPLWNSWGKGVPAVVWMPIPTISRLRREDGEFGIIIDK